MCDCYSQVKQKLFDWAKKNQPEGSTEPEIELQGYLFAFGGAEGVTHRSSNSVRVQYQAPKRAGGMKKVVQNTFVRAGYCPFCGVKYDESVAKTQ
jgi:hypothetical protein